MNQTAELPDGSPAKELMLALCQASDAMQEHQALLPPDFAEAMANALAASTQLVLKAHALSEQYAVSVIKAAKRPSEGIGRG